ncbi:MAG: 2-amino-4-hydroxy-6-hydroxymethyldihydropteridine diphosphokinase [Planctomycetes bacterium]|nr:2-amino-4-hydroxy-6-hydroxymethyldihydropteridine diphosphokinase [Planctomycetota bacterium]
MSKNIVAVSVGSNINPNENIAKARQFLSEEHTLLSESDFVITKPIGNTDQPDFTNGAFLLETNLNFEDFNATLKSLETRCGRKPTANKYAPRTLDLDIVVWNNQITNNQDYQRHFIKTAIQQLLPTLNENP